jgi:SSS family solute:Na+ symporter
VPLTLHLILLVGYSLALIGVGLWMSRAVRGTNDFFVAGRALTAPLLFSTVLAANIGAGTTIGAAGIGYRDGISAWWWNGAAAVGSLGLAFFVGPRIWSIARRHGLLTVGDYLELRFGRAVRGVVTCLIWMGTLSILAGQLIGGAAILTTVAGIPRWAGVMSSALLMTTYFVAGGLLSAAWVNLMQLAVLLVGFALATPLVLGGVGGLGELLQAPGTPDGFGSLLYSNGARSGWTFLFLLAPSFVVSPGLVQKAYGASTASTIRVGIGLQAAVQAAFGFLPALIGMSARITHPGITDLNLVLPAVLIDSLPPMLSALALAAVFSAEVSTCDAILFMLSTSLSRDLYKRFLRPEATDADVLRVARLAAVSGSLGGVALALALPTVIAALGLFYTLLGVTLFVPLVGGLFTTRTGTREAMAAIVAGGVTALAAVALPLPREWWFDPSVVGLVASMLAFGGFALLRKPTSPGVR